MELLELVREIGSEPDASAADRIARSRSRLVAAMTESGQTRTRTTADTGATVPMPKPLNRRRRRVATWTGFSVLGATALTVTLVAVNVVGVPGVEVGGVNIGGTEPAAASVLESAATAALEFSDPVVGAGQYVLVQTDGVFLNTGSAPGSDQPAAYLENYHDELYVPANRDDEWIWVQCVRTPAKTFGPESEALAQIVAEDRVKYDADIIRRLPAGVGPDGSMFSGYGTGTTVSDDYDALPRDPVQLLNAIYELNGAAGQSRDGQALEWITSTLRRGTVPAEFRAALYKTAAEIPGVTITEEQATLNGKTGVAIGRLETATNTRRDLIIDPATGQFIGEREVILDESAGVPAGTVTASSAVTTTVVDAAPADAALCGNHR